MQPQPLRAQGNLLRRFLARHIQHIAALAHAGGLARHFHRAHLRQIHHLRAVCRPRLETGVFRLGRGDVFLQGVPLAAMRAFALPFGHGAAAFGAAVDGFRGFGHGGGFLVFWVSGCLGGGRIGSLKRVGGGFRLPLGD